jgi:hypothetical protein
MTDETTKKVEEEAKAGLAAVGTGLETAGKNLWQRIDGWFAGHPGAIMALVAGLVIGFAIGYLLPH